MASPTVMVTGASGLVGTWLRMTAPAGMDLISLAHRAAVHDGSSLTADLRDAQVVTAALQAAKPSVVIHAAMARDVASITEATRNVANAASTVGAQVVYISTDAVFPGDGRPVDENTRPDPVWDYGRWKAEAEQLVLSGPHGWAVVRLPLVVSLDPPDRAVQRIGEGARQHEPTRWFSDETRQPAMASDVANAIWQIASLPPEQCAGTWQLAGPEILSRYEIAQRVVTALDLDLGSIVAVLAPADAHRPRHINMLDGRARDQIGWHPVPILS